MFSSSLSANLAIPWAGTLCGLSAYSNAISAVTNNTLAVLVCIARLADKEPEQGETLGVMGHTVGMYFSYLPATVAGYRKSLPGENDIEGPYMQLSTAAYFGNSGGGAWNSSGELCGIASFLTDKAPLMVFYIPQKTLAGIMRGAKVIPTTIDTTQPDPSLD